MMDSCNSRSRYRTCSSGLVCGYGSAKRVDFPRISVNIWVGFLEPFRSRGKGKEKEKENK